MVDSEIAAEERVSLHFDLKEGHTADLEIISAAVIAWVEALRIAAQGLLPGTDIKVELIEVQHGSAIYSLIGKWFDTAVTKFEAAPRRAKAIRGLAIFTLTAAYPTYDTAFGDDFTADDRARLERVDAEISNRAAMDTARQKFFRTVERERSITGVSIKELPDSSPLVTVPSTSFPTAGGLFTDQEEDIQERVSQTVLEVTLVKPALVHTPRAWTFKPDGLSEFDAVMKDAKVLQAIQETGFPEKLREGIRMTIRVEAREVLVDGEWKLVRGGRSVLRVITPKLDQEPR